jgi:hypothetical protein
LGVVLSYDRRVSPELLEALKPNGWAHTIVQYARSGHYSMDLQLRGYGGKPQSWATLYVGLTKVLDLHHRPSRGFRLDAHATYRVPTSDWQPRWTKSWMKEDQLAGEMREVENYLERVIPSIGTRYLREGAVQSAISGFASDDMVVVDRETTIAFSSQREKSSVIAKLASPLLDATAASNGEKWWASRPASLGAECDALAVAKDGRLLAIEIKPAKATGTITWAPIQVRLYANLLAEWARHAGDADEIIRGMLRQRSELGLTTHEPMLRAPIEVHPVIAIARGYSDAALSRLKAVHARLVGAGLDTPPLQVASVTLAGRLDNLEVQE